MDFIPYFTTVFGLMIINFVYPRPLWLINNILTFLIVTFIFILFSIVGHDIDITNYKGQVQIYSKLFNEEKGLDFLNDFRIAILIVISTPLSLFILGWILYYNNKISIVLFDAFFSNILSFTWAFIFMFMFVFPLNNFDSGVFILFLIIFFGSYTFYSIVRVKTMWQWNLIQFADSLTDKPVLDFSTKEKNNNSKENIELKKQLEKQGETIDKLQKTLELLVEEKERK